MLAEVDHIIIARMSEEDLDEVARIEKLCFSDPWPKICFKEELNHRFSIPLVIRSGSKIIGYTCLWYLEPQMEIANFAISPEYRSKGIGRVMMERVILEAEARNCRNLILSVRESNLPAINLYASFGFAEIHRRRGYYRFPAEDAIIMMKNL
jgi:ribosomal-protein-alanine N-acetyltransferase